MSRATNAPSDTAAANARAIVLPLALAQFIASYAGSNMNVAINSIAHDLDTSVRGVQTAITLFTLTMAALMIPGSKLSDIWGRKPCFRIGLLIYGSGAVLAALASNLTVLTIGYSLLEGVGSALMIPPIYILITVSFSNLQVRAKYFGLISGAAGAGAAAGPLIGGLITSAISWRASFLLQAAVVVWIIVLARKLKEPPTTERPTFDGMGAVLSAAGLFFIVLGVLQSGEYGWLRSRQDFTIRGFTIINEGSISPVWLFAVIGLALLYFFYRHAVRMERKNRQPLLATRVLHNREANLGLVTQNLQWLILQGAFFVVSVYVQTVHGYNAIETGLALTPAIAGILASSAVAERMAQRRAQATLIRAGFASTALGMTLLLIAGANTTSVAACAPGLFLMGTGLGMMLTASVNFVQSSFPENDQGEISGLSRSVSNLGSSLGTALAGSVLVSNVLGGKHQFAAALTVMLVFTVIGLFTALCIPKRPVVRSKT
jgi:MFS family permease